jgi:hypothetical protein
VADLPHVRRAFLLAPMTAPVVYWLWMVGTAIVQGPSSRLADAPGALPIIMAFGLPVAYAAAALAGAPAYVVARRLGERGGFAVAIVGAVTGAVVSLLLAPYFRGELFSIPLPVSLSAGIGAVTAFVWWRVARGAPGGRR